MTTPRRRGPKALSLDAPEAQAIAELAALPVRDVVRQLNERGVLTPRRRPWSIATVQRVLDRLRAAGRLPPATRGPGWRLGQRDEARRAEILAAVKAHGGNLTAAAKALDLTTGRVSQVVAAEEKKVNASLDNTRTPGYI